MLANIRNKCDIGEVVDRLDEQGYTQLLGEITEIPQRSLQTRNLLDSISLMLETL